MIDGMSARATVNRIRNPRFRWSGGRLLHWTLQPASSARLGRATDGRGVELVRGRSDGEVMLFQDVAVRPARWYRVEAVVHGQATADSASGCALMVEPADGTHRRHDVTTDRVVTPVARSSIWIRTYYRSADDVDRIRVGIILCGSSRSCRIDEVRLIPILEPELQSHPLSLPPPDIAVPPPVEVRRALIVTDLPDRPLIRFLSVALGDHAVSRIVAESATLCSMNLDGIDAVFLPDARPPGGLRSWSDLMRLAQERIVVISLPIFAEVAGLGGALRKVDQPDDPIHAAVAHASFVTRGFALRDAFPFAWRGSTADGFQHRQFRRSPALKTWCDRSGCVPVLKSLCAYDATSERVVALLKSLDRGAILAMDVEPVEAEPSSFDEPAAASILLLNALGRRVNGLGQYIVPHRTEAEFRNSLRDAAWRFPTIRVHDEDVPIEQVTDQLVTIGDGPARRPTGRTPASGMAGVLSAALPSTGDARPLILIRTGLTGGDLESVYGAWLYFKNLVRMRPHECPYARTLLSHYRLAWLPLCAPWEDKLGWRRTGQKRRMPMMPNVDDGRLSALVDIVACPCADMTIGVQGTSRHADRVARWLPYLQAVFGPGAELMPCRATEAIDANAGYEWRPFGLSVRTGQARTEDEFAASAVPRGATYTRIEIPASDADFPARSVATTAAVATILEHVIGLMYGLIAVNRGWRPVEFAPFAPVPAGQALIVSAADPILDEALVSA